MLATIRATAGRMSAFGVRFARHRDGAAAVEFGFLAPLLLLMLLATIEIGRAVNTDRHFTAAVGTAGDLVAREEYLGKSEAAAQSNLEGMMESVEHLMRPYDATALKLAVVSVRASTTDATDTTRVLVVLSQRHGRSRRTARPTRFRPTSSARATASSW